MTAPEWDGTWPDGTWKDFPPGGHGRYWPGVGPVFWVGGTVDRAQFDCMADEIRKELPEAESLQDAIRKASSRIVNLNKAYGDEMARAESEGGTAA